jgi:hypothetical protein
MADDCLHNFASLNSKFEDVVRNERMFQSIKNSTDFYIFPAEKTCKQTSFYPYLRVAAQFRLTPEQIFIESFV